MCIIFVPLIGLYISKQVNKQLIIIKMSKLIKSKAIKDAQVHFFRDYLVDRRRAFMLHMNDKEKLQQHHTEISKLLAKSYESTPKQWDIWGTGYIDRKNPKQSEPDKSYFDLIEILYMLSQNADNPSDFLTNLALASFGKNNFRKTIIQGLGLVCIESFSMIFTLD